ncbi:hypothetical protein DRV84_12095 [Rhodosalinus sediminis]|uniref:Uncharacterized protein n=1 Tax=Rhodosalinus sediminis TaxID=1940533 RepID=A0A3D9BPH4_9RHOB|nr:hypothetical protein [Rhodosalinus sediminis]REC55400.1 hypothetical protein DRV84_12095 [Rhodosalinus sediminis]
MRTGRREGVTPDVDRPAISPVDLGAARRDHLGSDAADLLGAVRRAFDRHLLEPVAPPPPVRPRAFRRRLRGQPLLCRRRRAVALERDGERAEHERVARVFDLRILRRHLRPALADLVGVALERLHQCAAALLRRVAQDLDRLAALEEEDRHALRRRAHSTPGAR